MADFFDKVKQGISRGVTTASVKSKEMLEVTRLKSQIDTVQIQKRGAIEELGNIVYTMLLKENIDEVRIKDKGTAILKLDSQIKDIENEILIVQNKARESLGGVAPVGKCTCGADIFEDTKFCSGCGKKVESPQTTAPQAEAPPSKTVCTQCKAELIAGTKFCNECGAKVL